MAKVKISQYDATAGNNTDIDSIDLGEGSMLPSNVNNALRELMAHLKDMDAGTQALTSPQLTSVDINGGTIDGAVIGGNSAAAISGTTLALSGNADLNGTLDVAGTALVTGVLTTTAATVSNGGGQFNNHVSVKGGQAFGSSATNLSTAVSKKAFRMQGSSDASTSLWMGALANDAQMYIQASNDAGNAADDIVLNPFGGLVGIGVGNNSPLSKLNVKGTQGNWRVDPDSVSNEIQVLSTTAANDGFRDFRLRTQTTIFETGGTEALQIAADGKQTINAAAGDGSPAVALTMSGGSDGFNWAHTDFQASLGSNSNLINMFGISGTARNAGYIGFKRIGALGATTNILTLGLHSADNVLNINGNSHVGIGTTDPSAGLTVQGADGSTSGTIMITSTSVASAGMACDASGLNFGADTGGFVFKTGASANDPTDTGTERMRILSGGGLTFNGDTAAANALDDYEEGVFSGSSSSSNLSSLTFSERTYTKIGRRVFLQMKVVATVDAANTRTFISQVVPIAALSNSYPFSGGGLSERHSSPFQDIALGAADSSANSANNAYWAFIPVATGAHTFNLFLSYET